MDYIVVVVPLTGKSSPQDTEQLAFESPSVDRATDKRAGRRQGVNVSYVDPKPRITSGDVLEQLGRGGGIRSGKDQRRL
jgi:hypothetical protein